MSRIPKKVADRLSKQLGAYQRVIANAKSRDVNESDTVTIVTDMLADLFGFDKYTDLTSEQSIRGTFCDLAVKIDGSIKYLIEVKAVGLTLKENHLRQAVNYGANQGIPWIVLTNGADWEIYRITFERPVGVEHTCSINILESNPRRAADLDRLFLLCKEGLAKAVIDEFHEHSQIVNRFVIAAAMRSEPILKALRKEIRRLAPSAKVSVEEIAAILPDVLKRDVVEGNAAEEAGRRVGRASRRSQKRNDTAREPKDGVSTAPGNDLPQPA